MTEKGPFDVAKKVLRESRGLMSAREEEETKEEIASAIRLLEAAGKVDKKDALRACISWILDHKSERQLEPCRDAIYSLFESLPDPEEERK